MSKTKLVQYEVEEPIFAKSLPIQRTRKMRDKKKEKYK